MSKINMNFLKYIIQPIIGYHNTHKGFSILTNWELNYKSLIDSNLVITFINRSEGPIYANFAGILTSLDDLRVNRKRITLQNMLPLTHVDYEYYKNMRVQTLEKHKYMRILVSIRDIIKALIIENRGNDILASFRDHLSNSNDLYFYVVFGYLIGKHSRQKASVNMLDISNNYPAYKIIKGSLLKDEN